MWATISYDACIEILLELTGANVNAIANKGVTPLHNAAYNGRVKVAKLLIEAGEQQLCVFVDRLSCFNQHFQNIRLPFIPRKQEAIEYSTGVSYPPNKLFTVLCRNCQHSWCTCLYFKTLQGQIYRQKPMWEPPLYRMLQQRGKVE